MSEWDIFHESFYLMKETRTENINCGMKKNTQKITFNTLVRLRIFFLSFPSQSNGDKSCGENKFWT